MEEKIIIKGEFSKNVIWLYAIMGICYFFLLVVAGLPEVGCIIGGLFLLFALIFFCIMFGYELVVTDKRIYGKTRGGLGVDLPLDAISSVEIGFSKSISIKTASGNVGYIFMKNREEVRAAIVKLLQERQAIKNTTIVQESVSNADELKKYKELLDSGVITQEEFDAKKKQILGL